MKPLFTKQMILGICAWLALGFGSTSIAQTVTNPPGLVSFWTAEGNALDSVGTNHGVLKGGASFTSGRVGQAFALDGVDDYVEVPENPSLHPAQEATLMAWVYFEQSPSQAGRFMHIIGLPLIGGDYDLQAESDNRFQFYVGFGTRASSTTLIQSGVWYHVAATYKAGERVEVFVNGQREGTTPINFIVATNPSPLTIGWSPVFGRPFHGRIDQVRVFDRVLSPAEIESVSTFEPGFLRPVRPGIRVSQVELCWDTDGTAAYRIHYSTALAPTLWLPLFTNLFRGTGGLVCTNDSVPVGQPQRYYRVVATNEPGSF